MTSSEHDFDVVVAGLGVMGSATAHRLAARGARVLGLERFGPDHTLGSSHGDSRIIREIYFEGETYVPLVRRAYELWGELEAEAGEALLVRTGGVTIGPPDGELVRDTLRTAERCAIPYERLDAAELRRRFPGLAPPDDHVAILDPNAGFLRAGACTAALRRAAVHHGAELRYEEPILSWEPDGDGVTVTTTAGRYRAARLAFTAGPWTRTLLPDVGRTLVVERQAIHWFHPLRGVERFHPDRFPIYLCELRDGRIFYGFPLLERGMKAAVYHEGETATDPHAVRRTVGDAEADPARAALRTLMPDAAHAVVHRQVCLFTNTPDRHFLIDLHPDHPQILVSSPCSGHGFKFAPAIGEIHADLLLDGQPRLDISPFRLARFFEPVPEPERAPEVP